MNRNRLLNAELWHAIASMGHGDLMIVCDAGFPIPTSARRIDLAIVPDVPDLETVLEPIAQCLIAERRLVRGHIARLQRAALEENKTPVSGRGIPAGGARTHTFGNGREGQVHCAYRRFRPLGNILLYSGVDVPAWFSKPGVVTPEYYRKKLKT